MSFIDRLSKAWDAFSFNNTYNLYNSASSWSPAFNSNKTSINDRSLLNALYNRIAIDVSSITIKHCIVDNNERLEKDVNDQLNDRITGQSNVDQTGRMLIQYAIELMLNYGYVAIVPTKTDINFYKNDTYNILSLRAGKIVEWYPKEVKVSVYNEDTGQNVDLIYPKDKCSILINPLYSVMNERNSTVQRLLKKLNMMDDVDEQVSSGKLNLIVQLPYIVKSETRQQQAERRRKELEDQLYKSKYGIAYTDGTEKITQLNRAISNNLLDQVKYLTDELYGQLGISSSVAAGTASEQEMLNYNNRTLEPIVSSICNSFTNVFLSKTARTQGHRIKFFIDPFRLVPINNLSMMVDSMIRDQVITANEARAIIGMEKSDSEAADTLMNPGMPLDKTLVGQQYINSNQYNDQYSDQEGGYQQ